VTYGDEGKGIFMTEVSREREERRRVSYTTSAVIESNGCLINKFFQFLIKCIKFSLSNVFFKFSSNCTCEVGDTSVGSNLCIVYFTYCFTFHRLSKAFYLYPFFNHLSFWMLILKCFAKH
jgi:hypothetical protein